MSHEVNDYFHNHIIQPTWTKKDVKAYRLSADDAAVLKLALANDLKKYYYSAVISISNALHDISAYYYSWATVELFYSIFYLNRSLAGINTDAYFYFGKSAFKIVPTISNQPQQQIGNTHEVVIEDSIRSSYYSPANGQLIGSLHPFRWFEKERNNVNYNQARFPEPLVPEEYRFVLSNGVRKTIAVYVNDDSEMYSFDESHAVIALPISMLKYIKRESINHGIRLLNDDEIENLRHYIKDKVGCLTNLVNVL